MTTATKTRSKAATPAESPAAAIAAERLRLLEAAEAILLNMAAEDRTTVHAEEQMVFDALGWDSQKVSQEKFRCRNVAKNQGIAGTAADREANAKAAANAAQKLASESPAIKRQIDELQQRLEKLQHDADESAKAVEHQTRAVARLRELLPEHIQRRIAESETAAKSGFKDDLAAIRQSILVAKTRLEWDPSRYDDRVRIIEALRWDEDLRETIGTNNPNPTDAIDHDAWELYRAGLRVRLENDEPQLAEIERLQKAALAEAESLRNHYVH